MNTPFDFFKYGNGDLKTGSVSLREIAEKVGTPVYIYSADSFLKPLKDLQSGLAGLDYLVCFAVKSNSNIALLKLLSDAGAGMDLVSGGELHRAGIAGVDPHKIVFSGVGKTPEEMAEALQFKGKGIYSFNVESVEELKMLSSVAEHLKKKAPVALRFNPDVDAKTHPYISTGLKKNKFGLNRPEITKIAREIKKYPGIHLKGISIHIGSQLLSLSPLNDAFGRAKALVEELNSVLPSPLEFLDLGGGIGITYKNEKAPDISKYCALVKKYFSKSKLKLLFEPGRVIAGNSGVLVTQVLYRKVRVARDFLVVDAGMNDLLRPALYGSFHDIVPVKKTTSSKKKKTDIVGPVCESADCFATDRMLSTQLEKGDLLAILSAGAYGFTMASNYNSRPRPPEVLVEGSSFRVIRERESYEDLIKGESL